MTLYINDILLAMAIGGVECVLITLFLVKAFPFSQATQNGKSRVLINLFVLGLLALVGYLHIMVHQYELAIWGAALLMWILFLFLLKVLKKENWKSLDFEAS
ncbi:hypothetical protein SAMN05660841_01567 [Sphingobacterium nematocida]|uniref:Uncharacterized protein n=2 Tax=Sphingobacterium nematocida TaxID=1513896 RepID=A0A1T5CRZ9_9SPHI|nr:hypothetical protein SAMN05660841_01567 [Sphingobacterium nematocida]